MIAKQLVPDPIPLDRIRCESAMKYSWFVEHEGAENRCRNRANYNINGHNLCKKHASVLALQVLLAQSEHKPGENDNG